MDTDGEAPEPANLDDRSWFERNDPDELLRSDWVRQALRWFAIFLLFSYVWAISTFALAAGGTSSPWLWGTIIGVVPAYFLWRATRPGQRS